jgi:hypothetical protein
VRIAARQFEMSPLGTKQLEMLPEPTVLLHAPKITKPEPAKPGPMKPAATKGIATKRKIGVKNRPTRTPSRPSRRSSRNLPNQLNRRSPGNTRDVAETALQPGDINR